MSRLNNLGQNIRKFRLKKGLTQAELALSLNLSYEYICRVERGQKFMSLRKLFELADVLCVKIHDLMDFD